MGNGFLLMPGKGQNLFLVEPKGYVHTGIFKELDEDCCIVMENGVAYDPRGFVFMGEVDN